MARGDGYSIIRRKRNGKELAHFEVRIPVPLKWRSVLGKETLRSTGTGDRRAANIVAPQIVAEVYAEWRRNVLGVSESYSDASLDFKTIAVQVGFDGMLSALEGRRKLWPADEDQYNARLTSREQDLRRLTRRLQDGELTVWEDIADRVIQRRPNLRITKGSEEYADFVRAIGEANIDAISVFNARANGKFDALPTSSLVQKVKAREAEKAEAGETILDLFERWAADALAKGLKRPATVNSDRKVIEQFSSFVGRDRAIMSITPVFVADYRDRLRELPPKWGSNKLLRGLPMREAASKARQLGLRTTAYTTVNKHLSTISPLYTWLAVQPAWAGLVNPCNGLFHAKVKGKNRRPSFPTATLNAILTSPLYTGFLAEGKEHVQGRCYAADWRFWVPLMCMFSGARVGEIAQLRIGDVRRERGVWFMHICEDDEAGLTTKSRKSRPAAVHDILKQIGIIDFHARQLERAGGDLDCPLFPELERNDHGQMAKVSRWWRTYLARIGVKDASKQGGDGKGTHSFRHTLADRFRSEAEILDHQIEVVLGHNQKSTTSGYGELSQGTVTMFKGWIDAVRFDGVDFSHLIKTPPDLLNYAPILAVRDECEF